MITHPLNAHPAIEWCVAARALPGEAVCGDLHAVIPWDGGVLLAVVDGLGHGAEAMAAARGAVEVLEAHAGEAVEKLVQQCHRALRDTRGVAMTIVSIDERQATATMLGIGNVEMVILRANPAARPRRESGLLRGGVVGYRLPPLRADAWPVAAGDVLVLATDGVREDFADGLEPADPLPAMVEGIMARNLRGTDDGLVLACRFMGKAAR